jgi:two-component system chemotaxis response regulator CheB
MITANLVALKVLVVDSSAYHRRTLSRIIAAAPGFEVVGTAADGEEAVRKVVTLRPDLLTLDLEMPRMDGYTFLRWLMRASPRPTLVVSSRQSDKSVFRALELGAADFVLKPVSYASERLGRIEGELVAKLREIAAARPERLAVHAERLAASRPEPAATAPGRKAAVAAGCFRCVAIGASTGGPPALQQVLGALDPGFPAAVVVAQHMPGGFTRMFAERLDRVVGLRVKEAEGGEELVPGLALLAPGGSNLVVHRGVGGRVLAWLEQPPPTDRRVPSVDRLLVSAAAAYGSGLLAVVLTGMGDDGSRGIRAARAAGGLTIAEAEESCVVFGMPREAIRTGAVQRVVPLPGIGPTIAREVACRSEPV